MNQARTEGGRPQTLSGPSGAAGGTGRGGETCGLGTSLLHRFRVSCRVGLGRGPRQRREVAERLSLKGQALAEPVGESEGGKGRCLAPTRAGAAAAGGRGGCSLRGEQALTVAGRASCVAIAVGQIWPVPTQSFDWPRGPGQPLSAAERVNVTRAGAGRPAGDQPGPRLSHLHCCLSAVQPE